MSTNSPNVRGPMGAVIRHPKVRLGLGFLLVLMVLAIAHPVLQANIWDGQGSVYHPETGYDLNLSHPTGPSWSHPLGTDALGRDVMSSLTFSLAPALQVTVLAALAVCLLSLVIGSVAAYYGGWVDQVVTSLGDAIVLIPPTLALLVVGLGRPGFGPVDAGLLFGLIYGLGPATLLIRSRALSVIEKPFIEAARAAGSGPRRIIGVHLVPHLLPFAGIQMMTAAIGSLVAMAFVQYLGATGESRVGLGAMIYSGLDFQPVLPSGYGSFNLGEYTARVGWFSMLSAGLAMTLISTAFYLIAVGCREAVTPKPHQ
ncbi:MAG: ABC transporter permease [Actinomycetota bacterium]